MKKPPQRTQLEKAKPIVIKIDPMAMRNGISLPKIKYELLTTAETEEVFHGIVLPIPRVLMYFLNYHELLVMSTILEETYQNGECSLRVSEIGLKTRLCSQTVSTALHGLRKIGLLLEQPDGKSGVGKIRKLDYKAIQHLNDLLEDENPDVYSKIRKATRKTNINNLTKEDILEAYDHKVLPPDHDPAEEEEYD